VPQDVAVVGFDDVEECLYTTPPLTSIAPDKPAIAAAAVDLLMRRMAREPDLEPQEVFPPFELVVRESSGG
jgi:DNA-binding LacI/PurR family transcriptional regulator